MESLACKIRERQTKIYIFLAVVFFLLGINVCPEDTPPDLPSVLYLSYTVLHLQDLCAEKFESMWRLWLVPVHFLIMYILSQMVMFMVWYPFWHMVEVVIIWIFQTETAMKLFVKDPNLYYSLRNNIAYVIQVSSVIFITFPALKEHYLPSELTNKEIDDLTADYSRKRKAAGNSKRKQRRAQ